MDRSAQYASSISSAFSSFERDVLTQLHRKAGETERQSTGEKSKYPVEMAPRNYRFLLLVVERDLNLAPPQDPEAHGGGIWIFQPQEME